MKFDPSFVFDMTLISYLGKLNSTLESVVPLAMFYVFSQERFMALVHSGNCCFFERLCHQGKTFRAEKILLDQLYAEVW